MNVIKINEYILEFQFLEILDRVSYNTSVYAIISNEKAFLIDAGYYEYSEQIITYLKDKNIHIEKVVVTHYHRDHAEGTTLFESSQIIASDAYCENYNKCQKISKEGRIYPLPSVLVDQELAIDFYNHTIKIFKTIGHTPCGLSVLIDDTILHVSDMLLEDVDKKIIIPYIDLNSNPKDHLASYSLYKQIEPEAMLLTHGGFKFVTDINRALEERQYYLEKFIETDFKCNLEECLLRSPKNYSMTEIHKLNKRNAKKGVSAQLTSFF